MAEPLAHLGGLVARRLVDVTTDLTALDGDGWWAVVVTYEGAAVCARFADVRPGEPDAGAWHGPAPDSWRSSLDRAGYVAAVTSLRAEIAAGEVYQANICRVLRATLPDPDARDVAGLAQLLRAGNPAPYGGLVRLPPGCHPLLADGLEVVTASPELFLARNGGYVESRPVKGTAPVADQLLPKDYSENVMIVDLVRNDLARVARTGTVEVPSLLAVEEHPGLVHLVSTVSAQLRDGAGWVDLLAATFPPGSVTGAPRSSAARLIAELEPVPRGPYCGAVGWTSGAAGTLAVGIRTFWREGDDLLFGTGAGITWSSDPDAEWDETGLKARTLLTVAARTWQGSAP